MQAPLDKGNVASKIDEKPQSSTSQGDDLSEKLRKLREGNAAGRGGGSGPSLARSTQQGAKSEETDDLFQTSDKDLEDMLADIPAEESFTTAHHEPDDAQVRALLEQLADAIPKNQQRDDDREKEDEDNSDGEHMQKEVDDVIARFRDEIELEKNNPSPKSSPEPPDNQDDDEGPLPDLSLPDVPDGPADSRGPSDMDDITARLSALRAPSEEMSLPDVPINKPAKGPKRLESRTNYTDDDVESWCTVCLADATLLCLGCEEKGEPYCVRCWHEMHVGPAAAFDDRSHKAVQFGKKDRKEKKVAVGA